ncbi:uncharacterized protein MYCFIDRAFT_201087 [Pseudocercospora fijiensis CIRAD86]|uniref:Threonine/serine exporter-like N-terminal domain-containing protein n=1 Tax=Pseudocercospora fijiensis (strain CIRAD86) TaxID=383855 RepID=N1Q740_PSEFD|nr:uncharacterized protein MYCFIDRAFT_201087 [Pseudocercospora fijiensis CIRAD86]EME87336.1 hypothetical protein MYCFIDRAFT_201087 [Pseudocercospora fijiensis CIRAD86]
MSTPVEELNNPFGDAPLMSDPGRYSPLSSGVVTSAEGATPSNAAQTKGKKKVGFTGEAEAGDRVAEGFSSPGSNSPYFGGSPAESGSNTPSRTHTRNSSGDQLLGFADRSHLPELSQQQTDAIRGSLAESLSVPRPRPAIRRGDRRVSHVSDEELVGRDDDGKRAHRQARAREALERGKRLEHEEIVSRHASPERSRIPSIKAGDILLTDLSHPPDSDDEEHATLESQPKQHHEEAYKLVRRHTDARRAFHVKSFDVDPGSGVRSGAVTPTEEQDFIQDYQPRPQHYRGGILGALLKLYNEDGGHGRSSSHHRSRSGDRGSWSAMSSPHSSPPESGTNTPRRHWYSHNKQKRHSTTSLAHLIGSSASIGAPAVSNLGEEVSRRLREQQEQASKKRPGIGKRGISGPLFNRFGKLHAEEEFRITNHIAETIARQKYLMKLCRGLMQYGAPTHRLEEYMRMSARVLEIDAQFLYIPGAMIMSFEDQDTHTSEVKLVKVAQGLDLGKLRDVHEVYKEVVHDKVGVEEATRRLKDVMTQKDKFSRLVRIPVYGLAAVCVGPFAFQARLIDLPIAFILGCILGILQLYIAPQSDLYSNVFEISAAVITSFLARAFGSIRNGELFCFSALAQSSIALILPGYTVLCASLELQSRSIVAGSVRMVYAIIYSLFLGFGITVGTAIYGMIDSNATSKTSCSTPLPDYWFFFFVPGFTMCLIIINQAKWKQAPIMMIIAFAGYIVNYFSSQRFAGNTQVSNTLGALAIGVMANLYSRIGARVENQALDIWELTLRPIWKAFGTRIFGLETRRQSSSKELEEGNLSADNDNESLFQPAARRVGYSLAAAAMLPAIFVQVPSGLAVNGSLVSGIASANQITGNTSSGGTQVLNTSTIVSDNYNNNEALNSIAFSVGYSVIQVAIGITVGLFLSAIVVYPFGKRRSGLFSF